MLLDIYLWYNPNFNNFQIITFLKETQYYYILHKKINIFYYTIAQVILAF